MKTNTTTQTLIAIATCATVLYSCDNSPEPTAPNTEFSEQAGEVVEEAVEATQETAGQAVEATREAASKAAAQTQEAIEQTGDRIESATD